MELAWIQAFVAVAEELHFSRAAERLHMAPSPLSQTIRRLERHLGVELFERSTRKVALTPAGESFLVHVRTVVEEMELAERAARARGDVVYGRVRVGFSGSLNHATLPVLVRAVRERHPNISFDLTARVATAESVQRIARGELDLGFVGMPVDSTVVAARPISVDRLGVVVPQSHPLARSEELQLHDVVGEGIISLPLSPGSRLSEATVGAFAREGLRPHVAQEVNDPSLMVSFVAQGMGVAVAPEGMVPTLPRGVVFRPLAGEPAVLVSGIAWSPHDLTAALAAVLAVAREVLPTPGAARDHVRPQHNE